MKDLPLAFKYNILVHSCFWPPVMFLEVESVFYRFEVLLCQIPVCNAFSFKLCYIKVQWSCFYFSASQINILHQFANGRQKKKEWLMWVAVPWLAHERNKQEQINCFLFFMFLCFPSSKVFFSRVLSGSQNDGISTSEEHMLCQCRVCCQLFLSEITEDHLLLQVSLVLAQSISLVTPGSSLKSWVYLERKT